MQENKQLMELMQKAENMAERRRNANKVVGILWNKAACHQEEVEDCKDENHGKTEKETELAQVAGLFELKRKISGKWSAKCKLEEK